MVGVGNVNNGLRSLTLSLILAMLLCSFPIFKKVTVASEVVGTEEGTNHIALKLKWNGVDGQQTTREDIEASCLSLLKG